MIMGSLPTHYKPFILSTTGATRVLKCELTSDEVIDGIIAEEEGIEATKRESKEGKKDGTFVDHPGR
jgi:hypothetical protein